MKKYQIIYADPPWSIQTTAQVPSGRPNSRPYVAMRMVDIYKMPISKIANDNSVLFLWAISPLLPEALYCIKIWVFEFKCMAFTWVKRNKKSNGWFWGMGWWTRSNPEFCLLGVRGSPKRLSAKVHSVIDERIGKHSVKPNSIRNKIVELMGDLPRIELFAREKIEGWDVWGNEVDSDIDITKYNQPLDSDDKKPPQVS